MKLIVDSVIAHQQVLITLVVCYGVILASVTGLWLISIPLRNISIIDLFWGAGFGIVALVCYVLQRTTTLQQLILMLLPVIWSVRYTAYIFRRNLGHGEDPRYTKLRSWVGPEKNFNLFSLRKVFFSQGNIMWLVSLPIMLGISLEPVQVGVATWIGIIVWAVGFLFEAVADWQLSRFKNNPENKGKILDTGLWRYSRHPNYFGNATLWWGIFIASSQNPWCLITVISPVIMTHFLVNVTGKRTLEKKMSREKPAYRDYMKKTSGFIPWFPKKGGEFTVSGG